MLAIAPVLFPRTERLRHSLVREWNDSLGRPTKRKLRSRTGRTSEDLEEKTGLLNRLRETTVVGDTDSRTCAYRAVSCQIGPLNRNRGRLGESVSTKTRVISRFVYGGQSNVFWVLRFLTTTLLLSLPPSFVEAEDAAQINKDAVVAQALIRLDSIDLDARPAAKSAVLRHLRRNPDGDELIPLARKYRLSELKDLLLARASTKSTETAGVEAARVLMDLLSVAELQQAIESPDSNGASVDGPALLAALGRTGHASIGALATRFVVDAATPSTLRRAAIEAVGRSEKGKLELLVLLQNGRFPEDLHVVLGGVLLNAKSAEVRETAAKFLRLPKTVSNTPLPSLTELVKMRGDIGRGAIVFRNVGTCIKCHQVDSEGKQVGPNLSEIGSKLARQAMYVSILDPSAAISFNFETHNLLLDDGREISGVVISDTDNAVTIRDAEGIDHFVVRSEIDEMKQQQLSLMPTGLVQVMTTEQLVDLVEYLMSLKKK